MHYCLRGRGRGGDTQVNLLQGRMALTLQSGFRNVPGHLYAPSQSGCHTAGGALGTVMLQGRDGTGL